MPSTLTSDGKRINLGRDDFVVRVPLGSAELFKVDEVLFNTPLTDDEQEEVNSHLDLNIVDWRDDQTLWLWESTNELNRWLDHLGNQF